MVAKIRHDPGGHWLFKGGCLKGRHHAGERGSRDHQRGQRRRRDRARPPDPSRDLVLADASMPKKDGYQVAEALKGDPATASIPVLILAGQLEGHPDQARSLRGMPRGWIHSEAVPEPGASSTACGAFSASRVRSQFPSAENRCGCPAGSPQPTAGAPRASDPMAQTMRSPQAPLAGTCVRSPRRLPSRLRPPRADAGSHTAPQRRGRWTKRTSAISRPHRPRPAIDLWGGEGVSAAECDRCALDQPGIRQQRKDGRARAAGRW